LVESVSGLGLLQLLLLLDLRLGSLLDDLLSQQGAVELRSHARGHVSELRLSGLLSSDLLLDGSTALSGGRSGLVAKPVALLEAHGI